MNHLSGMAARSGREVDRDGFTAALGDAAGRWLGPGDDGISLMVADDGGFVAGSATASGVELAFVGALHGPGPGDGWGGALVARPRDSADALLRRYLADGAAFLDGVDGQFAVAVADHRSGSLHLATDAGGVRNLYVAEHDGVVRFSSRIALMADLCAGDVAPDRGNEDFLLSYGFVPFGHTFFEGVTDLAPGVVHSWVDGERERRAVEKPAPWRHTLGAVDFDAIDEATAVDTLYDAFMTATEETASPSKRVAVLLGGVDSAAVAAALQRLGREVETFTFHYDRPELNQTHTDTLASFLDIEHHAIPITSDQIEAGLLAFPDLCNRPTNWPNYIIQTATLCDEMRRRGFDAAHSGDGCDGIFLGYPRTHTVAQLLSSRLYLPGPVIGAIVWLLRPRVFEYTGGRAFRVAMNLVRNFGRRHPARGFIPFRILDDISLRHLRADEAPPQRTSIEDTLTRLTEGLEGLSADRLAYRGKGLVGLNKNKLAGAGDTSGIPIVSPYLHAGLGALATGLPERLCRPEGDERSKDTGKYLLLRMLEDKELLPPSVIYQKKISAVEGPIDEWYFGRLQGTLRALLADLPFDADQDFLDNLLRSKPADRLYVARVSSDHLSTHEVSMLATYATFAARVDPAA